MRSNIALAIGVLAATSLATPIGDSALRRDVDAAAAGQGQAAYADDSDILTFALTLEHLETAFYAKAVKQFTVSDFADIKMYNNVLRLARDEAVHVVKISEKLRSLNRVVAGPCKYNFPFTTSAEFLKIASIIEGVGVSAYSGAAPSIRNKGTLVVAGAILPIEARHDAVLRESVGVPAYASPFDTPLGLNQVWTLASQFIVPGSCPPIVASLGLQAFPSLAVTTDVAGATIAANTTIVLKADASVTAALPGRRREEQASVGRKIYAAFLGPLGPTIVEARVEAGAFKVEIPAGISGQTYVVLTTNNSDANDGNTLAGPAVVEIADVVDRDEIQKVLDAIAATANGGVGAGVSMC